jgi:DNA polymerase III subunit epsilon
MSKPTSFLSFDLETTGTDSFQDVPVSYAFVEHRNISDGMVTAREFGIVNPGKPIPPQATAVHGITDEMARDGLALGEAVALIAERIRDCWTSGGAIVGMNVAYDLTMIETLCSKYDLPTLSASGPGPVLDVYVIDKTLDKWRKGKRTLGDLCLRYGVQLDNAHSADGDAEATLRIYEAMVIEYSSLADLELGEINETLNKWHHEYLSSLSEYFVKSGKPAIKSGRFSWPINTEV